MQDPLHPDHNLDQFKDEVTDLLDCLCADFEDDHDPDDYAVEYEVESPDVKLPIECQMDEPGCESDGVLLAQINREKFFAQVKAKSEMQSQSSSSSSSSSSSGGMSAADSSNKDTLTQFEAQLATMMAAQLGGNTSSFREEDLLANAYAQTGATSLV